jgi:hypothetical protein
LEHMEYSMFARSDPESTGLGRCEVSLLPLKFNIVLDRLQSPT